MDKRTDIIAGATAIFDTEGFRGVGVDRVLAPSGASTRTLYKQFGSKDGLVAAVLEEWHGAFLKRLEAEADETDPIGSLFQTLLRGFRERGSRGCMLLRAKAEYTSASSEIVDLVRLRKQEFRELIATLVAKALGRRNDRLTTQVWLLFEGAVAASSVADLSIVEEAEETRLCQACL